VVKEKNLSNYKIDFRQTPVYEYVDIAVGGRSGRLESLPYVTEHITVRNTSSPVQMGNEKVRCHV